MVYLVRVTIHGEEMPNTPAIRLQKGANSFGKDKSNDQCPSGDMIGQWGSRHAIITVSDDEGKGVCSIEDLGRSFKTFLGADLMSMTMLMKSSSRRIRVGDFIGFGKNIDRLDLFQFVGTPTAALEPEEEEAELLTFSPDKLSQTQPLNESGLVAPAGPILTDSISSALVGNDSLGPRPTTSNSSNMNISVSYPMDQVGGNMPVSIRIEPSPTKEFTAPLPGILDDSLSKTKKSLTFQDSILPSSISAPMHHSSSSIMGDPVLTPLSLRAETGRIPAKSSTRISSVIADGGVSSGTIADALLAETYVIAGLIGARTFFPEYDENSIPDYVMIEAVAESLLLERESSISQLVSVLQELRELGKQCAAGVSIDEDQPNSKVSSEFDALFRDLIFAILSNAVQSLNNLASNSLMLALRQADIDKYDIGAYPALVRNKERLESLNKFYQQANSDGKAKAASYQFNVVSSVLSAIVEDLEEIKSILMFINRRVEDAAKSKRPVAQKRFGAELDELRSLKGKRKLLTRVLCTLDGAVSRAKRMVWNKWKAEWRLHSVVSQQNKALRRLGYVAKRYRAGALQAAFAKWFALCQTNRILQRSGSEYSKAQMEVLVLQSKLHELASNTDLQATIAGERAINKELSATNSELRQIIRELEAKFLEFCQAPSMPVGLRKTSVREVYVGQEDELAAARKTIKTLTEQLHELQQTCIQAELAIAAQESNQRGRDPNAPPHKAWMASQLGQDNDRLQPPSYPGPGGAMSSRAVAAGIVVFEVRRLRNQLKQAKEEVKTIKKQAAAEVARRTQLNLVVQDLDRRLTDTHKGYSALRAVLLEQIGENGLLEVMRQVEVKCPGFAAALHPLATSDPLISPSNAGKYQAPNASIIVNNFGSSRLAGSSPNITESANRTNRINAIDTAVFGGTRVPVK